MPSHWLKHDNKGMSEWILQLVSNIPLHLETVWTQPRDHSLRAGVIISTPLVHVYEEVTQSFSWEYSLLSINTHHLLQQVNKCCPFLDLFHLWVQLHLEVSGCSDYSDSLPPEYCC